MDTHIGDEKLNQQEPGAGAPPRDCLRISVRSLVEFVLKSGDIDRRRGSADSVEAMLAGARIHRQLQREAGGTYHAEVPLSDTTDMGEFDLLVEGRADGLIYDDDRLFDPDCDGERLVVDEIKTMQTDVLSMTEPVFVHLAQARCYGFFAAKAWNLERVDIRLTYVRRQTMEVRQFTESLSKEALAEWYASLIDSYRRWAEFSFTWKQIRNASVKALPFPFPWREGQKQLASDVYRAIRRKKPLFIQAPTGTGKTLSVLYPAVKAMGEGLAERIFYLTSKTVTRRVASDAVRLLSGQGYRAKTVEIIARDRLCLMDETRCNPDECPYAKGHFDRVNDAVYDLLTREDLMDRECIVAQAKAHTVCPFELALDLSSWSDNVLCDYNYVFDPNVRLRRFFAEGETADSLFLIDEAHNLVDRAREMYSETLYLEDFSLLRKAFSRRSGAVGRQCSTVRRRLKQERDAFSEQRGTAEGKDWSDPADFDLFVLALNRLFTAMLDDMDRNKEPLPDDAMEVFFRIRYFLAIFDWMDERYKVYCDEADGRFGIHLYCLDPSVKLTEALGMGVSSVFFSATLLPVNYYKSLLCALPDPYAVYSSSVFSSEQRLLLAAGDVTSLYRARSEEQYRSFARYVYEIVSARQGNYMVFAPSYAFMEKVASAFAKMAVLGIEILVQEQGMTESGRDRFLAAFSQERSNTLAAFCVLGGLFSEGIDLTGEKLIGVIVLGAGLPQVSAQTQILREYFDRQKKGFDYAFLYPGMNKVMQAAGRLIRTAQDRGVIALLDSRFLQPAYRATFPREWSDLAQTSLSTVRAQVDRFWEKQTEKH